MRVLVEVLSNRRPMLFPISGQEELSLPDFSAAALSRSVFSSSDYKSNSVRKSFFMPRTLLLPVLSFLLAFKDVFKDIHKMIDFLFYDDQRRRKAQDIAACAVYQDAPF